MTRTNQSAVDDLGFESSAVGTIAKEEIRCRIEEIGVVPAVRVTSVEDVLFVADALAHAGIPILEIPMNMPGAIEVLSHVVKHAPRMIVGGGSITNVAMARQCLGAGAKFLTSDGLVLPVVEFASKENVVVFPGHSLRPRLLRRGTPVRTSSKRFRATRPAAIVTFDL
jgi:hypothetical protein